MINTERANSEAAQAAAQDGVTALPTPPHAPRRSSAAPANHVPAAEGIEAQERRRQSLEEAQMRATYAQPDVGHPLQSVSAYERRASAARRSSGPVRRTSASTAETSEGGADLGPHSQWFESAYTRTSQEFQATSGDTELKSFDRSQSHAQPNAHKTPARKFAQSQSMKWLNNPKPRGGVHHRIFGIGPPALGHPGSKLIHPNSLFAQLITGLSSALLIYVAIVTPVVVGFFWEREPCDPLPTLEFDMFVDCVFVLEILLNFFIGVYHQGVYHDDLEFVAWTYVSNNFAFDIITSIPVALVEYATIQQCQSREDTDTDFNPNNLRIVRIVKPLRIFKFGALILVSEEFFCLLSPTVQRAMRVVDRVTLKGSAKPMCLYTYDVPFKAQRRPSDSPFPFSRPDGVARAPSSGSQGIPRTQQEQPNHSQVREELDSFFQRDSPPATSETFREAWNQAMVAYVGGVNGSEAVWSEALAHVEACLSIDPTDGPALALQRYILGHRAADGKAPEGWPGFRALDEK